MTDYTELIRSLRNCSNNRCAPCDCGWFDKYQVDESCKEIIMWKAAAAIEALQAEAERLEPKRGEWIHVREVDIPGEIHPVAFKCMCSMCRNEYLFPKIPRYCPDCGSMNTAKIEVQE